MPRSIDRCSFVYLDQASINVDGGSIIAWREGKKLVIPAASIVTVVLGPGSKITHDAIKLLGGVGTCVVWMGADQTRFYAAGRPLSSSSKLVEAQARIVSNSKKRLECAKKMYGLGTPATIDDNDGITKHDGPSCKTGHWSKAYWRRKRS